jgi:hypothetical protein
MTATAIAMAATQADRAIRYPIFAPDLNNKAAAAAAA